MKSEKTSKSLITESIEKSLKKRHAKERRFKLMGRMAIGFGFLMLVILIFDITTKAMPAFYQHHLQIDVEYSEEWLELPADKQGIETQDALRNANYRSMIRNSFYKMFPEVKGRKDKRSLVQLLSSNTEFELRDKLIKNPELIGTTDSIWLLADGDVDSYLKSDVTIGDAGGRINEKQALWLKKLYENEKIKTSANYLFFTNSDSRDPELAGIKGALVGTLLTMLVTLAISFPIGLATAIYLEEFAPRNKWTDIIEININNLAAVPSIVFGLLGLAVIINLFGLPRSASLVGGIVLSLMTLPTIIIASRASIKAVPISIKEAATGLGASKMQVTLGHVVPIAMPGILTGTIIGIAQALGETAPLLMIGMVAFIVDIPGGFTDAATVMPVQIFLWADSPEQGFLAKTSAAIFVLLIVLFTITFSATLLRKKFENKVNK
jgi:phosphate transport system permease protein